MKIGDVSYWFADVGLPQTRRSALTGDTTADVAIIGGGYTGLWTAYYLRKADPSLRVVVLEKEFAGFGASGRNGGWLTGGFAWHHDRYAQDRGRDAVMGMVRALNGTVEEVIRVCRDEGIDADILPNDELVVATTRAQLDRLRGEIAHRRAWGEVDRVFEVSADEACARVNIPGIRGGMVVKGVARVQPAKLVRGLADAAERAGAVIHEGTAVLSYESGRVVTQHGVVRAPIILRATEGFTAGLPGHKREWLPLNTAQIVTKPLPQSVWDQIGWAGHELFADCANSYVYCQRTRDGRIALGGRGIPYRYGSVLEDHNGTPTPETIDRLTALLQRHFPTAAAQGVDHAWCGIIAVPRDWCATVGLDRKTGLGWAGGYVGVGVSTANLAGRTLTDLAIGRDSDLTGLAWVNRRPRNWEPEPLRWLGVHTMYSLLRIADNRETRLGIPPSRFARLGKWITGK
ncbi:DadA Glycine/D-amino acid oxidases (deaminating) [Paracoccaceae bacterium]|jgi:glycine/D-amino acid oxidase-like deaminating enzyme